MNVGVALREILLEGFLVAGELGGGGVGDCLVGVSSSVGGCAGGAAARGCCGACLVEVSAITADVGAVVALATMSVPASTLVAVIVPAVVIALVAAVLGVAVVPAGVFAAVPVLF